MLKSTQLFRVNLADSADQPIDRSEKNIWRMRKIMHGLKRRCRKVKEFKPPKKDRVRRFVEATDRVSDLKFVAVMEHNEKPQEIWPLSSRFTFREQIVQMYYVAGFGGRRGLEASEGAANYLDEQTEVSRVFIEGGILYVIAEPLFVVDFDIDFFLEQLDLYLADVRLVGNYLYG